MSKSYTFNSPYFGENGEHIHEWTEAHCGNCGRSVEQARFYKNWNYCPYCGEKIDWDEK
jgi:endogenous inhibitor of DNA gyrase (YacG/DUF329 family)